MGEILRRRGTRVSTQGSKGAEGSGSGRHCIALARGSKLLLADLLRPSDAGTRSGLTLDPFARRQRMAILTAYPSGNRVARGGSSR